MKTLTLKLPPNWTRDWRLRRGGAGPANRSWLGGHSRRISAAIDRWVVDPFWSRPPT